MASRREALIRELREARRIAEEDAFWPDGMVRSATYAGHAQALDYALSRVEHYWPKPPKRRARKGKR